MAFEVTFSSLFQIGALFIHYGWLRGMEVFHIHVRSVMCTTQCAFTALLYAGTVRHMLPGHFLHIRVSMRV